MADLTEKYRPQTLDEVWGNDRTKDTLRDIIKSGRIPKTLILDGPFGTGKTSTALIVGREILRTGFSLRPEPYDLSPKDYDYDHIDKFIRSVERTMDSVKVIIMNEAQRLTPKTQELLLHPLEFYENLHIIFTTTETHIIDGGIRSRGQVYTFEPPPMLVLIEKLAVIAKKEDIAISDDVLKYLITQSGRIPRDCLKNLGTLCGYDKPITIEVVRSYIASNVGAKYVPEQK